MTLLDLNALNIPMTLSHITARQELRTLMRMIQLPQLESRLAEAS